MSTVRMLVGYVLIRVARMTNRNVTGALESRTRLSRQLDYCVPYSFCRPQQQSKYKVDANVEKIAKNKFVNLGFL
jgi:hypothetical protein